jgi:hypothetical protein
MFKLLIENLLISKAIVVSVLSMFSNSQLEVNIGTAEIIYFSSLNYISIHQWYF